MVRSATWLDLRAAWWTARGLRSLRSQLREQGLDARVTPPPQLPDSALPAVSATARCLGATCLERSLLLQEWLLAHGRRHTLIIGVPSPGEPSFIAHAWLEGHDPAADGLGFAQLVRLDPR
ncbi:MAG: lasso peptide biosynthesis B2 protein [Solirubrobacterales bacterium]|nr:lasso peptide biosynthesis B2 protein [Solirubrobacterales bacterium]